MPLRLGTLLPSLDGATEWLNGEVTREALAGKLLLVHFWSVSCGICHDNMPTIGAWREQYAAQGLRVVAVHMPRQEVDTDVARVREDARSMGMTEPCAIDNKHTLANAFQNEYVPAYFLFTGEGALCGRAAGYHGLTMIERPLLRQLQLTRDEGAR